MSKVFTEQIRQVDNRYLTDQELQGLDHYLQTYHLRNQAYQVLTSKANELVL